MCFHCFEYYIINHTDIKQRGRTRTSTTKKIVKKKEEKMRRRKWKEKKKMAIK